MRTATDELHGKELFAFTEANASRGAQIDTPAKGRATGDADKVTIVSARQAHSLVPASK